MKKENIALIIFLIFIVGAGVYFYSLETVPQNVGGTNPVGVHTEPQKVIAPTLPDTTPIIPQAKVSTERWKTCRNEEYGYEFKYPGEWHASTNRKDSKNDCVGNYLNVSNGKWINPDIFAADGGNAVEYFGPVGVSDQKHLLPLYSGSTSLDEYLLRIQKTKAVILKKGEIDGEKAAWVKLNEKGNIFIYIFHNKNLYDIVTSENITDVNETILSTFKFID